jgi:nucleoside-triphosphatase
VPAGRARLLVEGRPGAGKTTAIGRLSQLLRDADIPLCGFLTKELRQGRSRVGFEIETFDGERGVLAHVKLPGPPRVGRYGVDLQAFERVALPAVRRQRKECVVLIDELGKMELASSRFREAVVRLFDQSVPIVATVQMSRHPITDALKRRPDVETLRLTADNRDRLPRELAERLGVTAGWGQGGGSQT